MKRPEGFDGGARGEQPAHEAKKPRSARAEPTPSARAPKAPRQRPTKGTPAPSAKQRRAAERAARRAEHAEARRFTRGTRRRRATVAIALAVVATLTGILAIAVYSPVLALRDITVEGAEAVNPAQVVSAVRGQLGTPLALLDFGEIRKELSTFRQIRSYVTETVPPSTLIIHIVERTAVASIRHGGAFDHVDPAGVVLSTSADAGGLPIVDLGSGGTSGPAFRSAVRVLLAMPPAVVKRVQGVSASSVDDVLLTLVGTAPRVVWGGADQSSLKASVLAAMLKRPECASQAVIDVSAPLAPICGPR